MDEDLTIDALGAGGDGVARRADGAAVFIPLSAPGDVVRASLRKDREGYWRGQIREILRPGASRAQPPCPHYGWCGGCALQHINQDAYRRFKHDMLDHALQKAEITAAEMAAPIFISPGTRRRATFSAFNTGKHVVVGFNERRSDKILEVPECRIVQPSMRVLMNAIRDRMRDILPLRKTVDVIIQQVEGQTELSLTGDIPLTLAVRETLAAMTEENRISRVNIRARARDEWETVLSRAPMIKTFGALRVALSPGAFLQASDESESALMTCVREASAGAKNILDLFCGCGTFAGAVSPFAKVRGVDMDAPAVRALTAAGVPASARNLFTDPVEGGELKGYDTVILDPPRAGAMAQARKLARSDVPRIIYVSCNPVTFAKDARVLIDGGYHLNRVQPVDQFVWSAHLEVVGIFSRAAA
jgi:23S rRNA (uracil1939-C5)-methyltransferase